MSVVCCEIEVSASDRSLVQRSRTECGVSECDHKTAVMRRAWPTRGCCAMEKKYLRLFLLYDHLRHTVSHERLSTCNNKNLNNCRSFLMMRRTLVILLPLATCALFCGYKNEGLHTFDIYVILAP
jgi:hypothetical protein